MQVQEFIINSSVFDLLDRELCLEDRIKIRQDCERRISHAYLHEVVSSGNVDELKRIVKNVINQGDVEGANLLVENYYSLRKWLDDQDLVGLAGLWNAGTGDGNRPANELFFNDSFNACTQLNT